jgi:hypothetical protein
MKRIFIVCSTLMFALTTYGQNLQQVTTGSGNNVTSNTIRLTDGFNQPVGGSGLQLGFGSSVQQAFITSYDWDANTYRPMFISCSYLGLNSALMVNGAQNDGYALGVNGSFIAQTENGNNYFSYNGAADVNLRFLGRGSGGRALVHDAGNQLVLSYGGDFTGGVRSDAVLTVNAPAVPSPYVGARNPIILNSQNFGGNNSSCVVFANGGNTIADIGSDLIANGGKDLFLEADRGNNSILLNPYGTGNVGIGVLNPQSRLAVNGTITAQRVKVTATGWADFVFDKDYQLPSLKETAAYIAANKHLPGVPTEKEIEKDGQDVGEMNKVLLQKVEELTLQLIKLQQQVDELKTNAAK